MSHDEKLTGVCASFTQLNSELLLSDQSCEEGVATQILELLSCCVLSQSVIFTL